MPALKKHHQGTLRQGNNPVVTMEIINWHWRYSCDGVDQASTPDESVLHSPF